MIHLSFILGEVREQRPFPKQFLKDGYPNLLVLHPGKEL